jgi:hypothetical protein
MLGARVGVTGYVHDCRAWHCRHRAETANETPKPCPQHGVTCLHTTPRVRQLKFHDLRRSHASLLAIEYGLCGAVAGAGGATGALALAWGFLEHVVDLRVDLPWVAVPATAAGCALVTAAAALGAGARALAVRPMEALR